MKANVQSFIKVIFEDGDFFTTRINLNKEDAEKYYLNKEFNVGFGIHDLCKKCVKVEFV